MVPTSIRPTGNYMFKVNKRNTRTMCEICSELTIKTPELLTLSKFHPCSCASIVKFEQLNAGWKQCNIIFKLKDVTSDYETLQSRYTDLAAELNTTKSRLRYEANYERTKWEEFDRLADQMKQFSKTMSPIRNSISNTSLRSRLLDDS